MNNIVIVIPTLNEEENIKILFNKLTATKIAFDFYQALLNKNYNFCKLVFKNIELSDF